MGGTYAGNFVSCAAACAVIDVFDRDDILSNVQARGKQLSAGASLLLPPAFICFPFEVPP
jgi:4-aminobutyrate aminotransferase-like enzyme